MNRLRTSFAAWPARAALAREPSGPAPHLLPLPRKALAALLCAGALALAAALALVPPGAAAPDAPAGSMSSPFSSLGAGLKDLSGLDLKGSRALSESASAQRDRAAAAYGRLPLSFEPNRGQTDARVRYMARGAGYSLFLTPKEAVLSLKSGKGRDRAAALRLGFEGANANPPIAGHSALPGKVNYLKSSDPARQQRNVPTFAKASYRELWPGIGATFYGRQGQLEYDFELAPHADPEKIVLSFAGAESLRIGARGELKVRVGGKTVRQLAPQSYQVEGGRRQVVESRYVLLPGKRVGIRLGAYDRSRPLVIDPVLAYSTYLGGILEDIGEEIAVDASGSAYVTGRTQSGNFPTTPGAFRPTKTGEAVLPEAFVTKLTPDGTDRSYSTYLGPQAEARGIAVDRSGSAFVVGGTGSADFPTTTGAFDRDFDETEGFITKLSPDGSRLAYSTYLEAGIVNIAVDGSGSAYVTGSVESGTDFPTRNPYDGDFNGEVFGDVAGGDAFVTKLNPAGSDLDYSTYLGGSGGDLGEAIAVDGSGSAYVTGETESDNFPTQAAIDGSVASVDLFATKLNPAGNGLAYSTFLGGEDNDRGRGIAVDGSGSAYVLGRSASSDFPTTPSAYRPAIVNPDDPCCDATVTKLNPAGSALAYSTFLGGSGFDDPFDLTIDGAGNAYVVGDTQSGDFPTAGGPLDTELGGCCDAFLSRLSAAGSDLDYSTYLGGSADEFAARGVAFGSGSAYLTGLTFSDDFPTTLRAFDREYNGAGDAFVARFAFSPTAITGPASRVGRTAATVNGTVNPSGSATTYRFEYGLTTAYGQTTPLRGAGAGTADQQVSAALAGLLPGRTYHYRLVATNEFGTTTGADRTLRTAAPPPPPPKPPKCTIRGRSGNDVIRGTGGNDVICAAGGNDVVYGGGGNDLVFGGGGNDIVRGQGGNDRLSGGDGNDQVIGDDGDDRLRGDSGRDILSGQEGRDFVDTRDNRRGNDVAKGGRGDDDCETDRGDVRSSC